MEGCVGEKEGLGRGVYCSGVHGDVVGRGHQHVCMAMAQARMR